MSPPFLKDAEKDQRCRESPSYALNTRWLPSLWVPWTGAQSAFGNVSHVVMQSRASPGFNDLLSDSDRTSCSAFRDIWIPLSWETKKWEENNSLLTDVRAGGELCFQGSFADGTPGFMPRGELNAMVMCMRSPFCRLSAGFRYLRCRLNGHIYVL